MDEITRAHIHVATQIAGTDREVTKPDYPLDALQQLHRILKKQGVGLVLANVNEEPLRLIRRSGFDAVLGDDAIVPTVAGAFDARPMPAHPV